MFPFLNPFYINVNAYANAQPYAHTAELIKHTVKILSIHFILNPFYGVYVAAHIRSSPIPEPIAIHIICSRTVCSFLFFIVYSLI